MAICHIIWQCQKDYWQMGEFEWEVECVRYPDIKWFFNFRNWAFPSYNLNIFGKGLS